MFFKCVCQYGQRSPARNHSQQGSFVLSLDLYSTGERKHQLAFSMHCAFLDLVSSVDCKDIITKHFAHEMSGAQTASRSVSASPACRHEIRVKNT